MFKTKTQHVFLPRDLTISALVGGMLMAVFLVNTIVFIINGLFFIPSIYVVSLILLNFATFVIAVMIIFRAWGLYVFIRDQIYVEITTVSKMPPQEERPELSIWLEELQENAEEMLEDAMKLKGRIVWLLQNQMLYSLMVGMDLVVAAFAIITFIAQRVLFVPPYPIITSVIIASIVICFLILWISYIRLHDALQDKTTEAKTIHIRMFDY